MKGSYRVSASVGRASAFVGGGPLAFLGADFPFRFPHRSFNAAEIRLRPPHSCCGLDDWWLTQLLAGALKILVTHSFRSRNRQ
jgi:hypothetical protein